MSNKKASNPVVHISSQNQSGGITAHTVNQGSNNTFQTNGDSRPAKKGWAKVTFGAAVVVAGLLSSTTNILKYIEIPFKSVLHFLGVK